MKGGNKMKDKAKIEMTRAEAEHIAEMLLNHETTQLAAKVRQGEANLEAIKKFQEHFVENEKK